MSKAAAEGISWQEWGPAVFEQAAREGKPVLLQVVDPALWPWSSFADVPQELNSQRLIPVRVSAYERPDIGRCYGKNVLSLLTADGRQIPIASSYKYAGPQDQPLSPAEVEKAKVGFLKALWQEVDAYRPADGASGETRTKAVWTGAVGEFKTRKLQPDGPKSVLKGLKVQKDSVLHFNELLIYGAHEWGDQESQKLGVDLWAKEIGPRSSLDKFSGDKDRFVRVLCTDLASHIKYTDQCWKAHSLATNDLFKEAAFQAVTFLTEQYFDQKARAFKMLIEGEPVLHLADANALAVLTLLQAWAHLGKEHYFDLAEEVLHSLEKKMYDPVLGMIHCQAPGRDVVHGLLSDNALTMLAFTEAYLMTGHKPYREFADQLGRFLFQEMWEREYGGFLTRANKKEDVGPLKEPRLDARENAVAFEAVWRLSEIKGSHNYRKWVDWGLKSPALPENDPDLSRIQDMLTQGRMELELVGVLSDPKTEALLAAVNKLYLPRKIVSFVDPNDQDYILAHKLEAPSYPRLFACGPDLKRVADTDDPAKVPEIIKALRS